MDFSQVKGWIVEHIKDEEVVKYLSEIAPPKPANAEAVASFLETPEGQKLLQPVTDRRVQEGIKTYKENHLPAEVKAAVNAELLRINPEQTPEQKQIRELREAVEKAERERSKDLLKRQIVEESVKVGVEPFFIDDYLPGSLDEARLYLSKVKGYVDKEREKKANEILATQGHKPRSGEPGGKDPSKMAPDERMKFYTQETEKRLSSQ